MQGEPRYQGKSVSEWMKHLDDGDENYRKRAYEALAGTGESALPVLVDAYKPWASDQVRCGVLEAIVRMGPKAVTAIPLLTSALSDSHSLVRCLAATTLMLLGSNAHATVPTLKSALTDKDVVVRMRAAQALVAIDPSADGAAVPVLVATLGFNGMDWIRSDAAKILGGIGPRARSAVATLMAVSTSDPSEAVRKDATHALKEIQK
ncbi:HEAT repeat domain-containing protein [bacterium]|nr:HEAT repeat domain-containing protein [bacterium]